MRYFSTHQPMSSDYSIIAGDCLEEMRKMAENSVNCCVTSPPYFGLRDYGTASWEGGDAGCDHLMPVSYKSSTLGASTGGRSEATHQRNIEAQATPYRDTCGKCNAVRIDSQLGLEATPEAYVANMVAVFREVRRVLRDDGTLWLNLGDSYNGSGKGQMGDGSASDRRGAKQGTSAGTLTGGLPTKYNGLKSKDLIGIPWRVAFALQADGWYLRSDIIWHKPNPMPESVTDRCTKSHEYIFLMSKSAKYWYDAEAIKEESISPAKMRTRKTGEGQDSFIGTKGSGGNDGSRNKRDVWTVATAPFKGAHFATFPPKLIEPCILAGCPVGGIVLDPFMGSGTTLAVAKRLGRNSVGIDLNPSYCDLARKRVACG